MKNLRTLFSLLTGGFLLFITACAPQQVPSDKNQSAGTSSAVPVVAERADLEGKWQYTMSNPEQGTLTGNLLVRRGGAVGYSGSITVKEMRLEAETVISKAEIKGQNFVYNGVVKTQQGNIPFEMMGTIKGTNMEGQNRVQLPEGLAVFKVSATRQ